MRPKTFIQDIIDDIIPMYAIGNDYFDYLFSRGYRMLGDSFICHNKDFLIRFIDVNTIPLRINLEKFTYSKSQNLVKKRHSHLSHIMVNTTVRSIEKELFTKHYPRVSRDNYANLLDFIPPTEFFEERSKKFNVSCEMNEEWIAASYIHWGDEAVSATYCIFDPEKGKKLNLGTYTMLLEIDYALRLNKKYYYLGYAYDLPSHFDYKFNFHGLEYYNWSDRKWYPQPRLPLQNWRTQLLIEHDIKY